MPTNSETVSAFCALWAKPGGFAEAVRAYFTDTTDYENVGMSRTTGIAETLALIESFERHLGLVSIGVDMLHIVEQGNVVLTERVDHMIDATGAITRSIRLMGIFEVRDGKITMWRDYFDTLPFQPG